MIIQNVELLALGQIQTVTEEASKDQPKTATLALTPQEAEKLVFASDFGVVRLALRGIEDYKNVDTPGIIRNDLISRIKELTIITQKEVEAGGKVWKKLKIVIVDDIEETRKNIKTLLIL